MSITMREWDPAPTDPEDAPLCVRCEEFPRHGRTSLCVHCHADRGARAQVTIRQRGSRSGHHKIYRARRVKNLRCPEPGCGVALDLAHATYHAWTAHHVVVPCHEREEYFRGPGVLSSLPPELGGVRR